MAARWVIEILVRCAMSTELDALALAHLAEERARELRLRVDLPRQLGLQHQELGDGGAVVARGGDRDAGVVRERGEVVGAAAHRVEERVVRLLDPGLLLLEHGGRDHAHDREAALAEDVPLALVGAADLVVRRRARHAERLVERGRPLRAPVGGGRRSGEQLGGAGALRGEEREDAAGHALEVARALGGGAVDEQRLAAAHREPDGVVVLDLPEVVERHAEEAVGHHHHRRAQLQVALEPRLPDDEPRRDAPHLLRRDGRHAVVEALQLGDDLAGARRAGAGP